MVPGLKWRESLEGREKGAKTISQKKKKNSFFWKIKKKENPFTTDQKKEDHNPRPTNNQVLASQCATVHASHFDFLLEIFY